VTSEYFFLFRCYEMLFRLYEMLFRFNEILFRFNEIIWRETFGILQLKTLIPQHLTSHL
jgi:hypothetical protein